MSDVSWVEDMYSACSWSIMGKKNKQRHVWVLVSDKSLQYLFIFIFHVIEKDALPLVTFLNHKIYALICHRHHSFSSELLYKNSIIFSVTKITHDVRTCICTYTHTSMEQKKSLSGESFLTIDLMRQHRAHDTKITWFAKKIKKYYSWMATPPILNHHFPLSPSSIPFSQLIKDAPPQSLTLSDPL
jgi:hypothetical protein